MALFDYFYLILGTSSSTIKSAGRKWCFAIRKRFITDSLTWRKKSALCKMFFLLTSFVTLVPPTLPQSHSHFPSSCFLCTMQVFLPWPLLLPTHLRVELFLLLSLLFLGSRKFPGTYGTKILLNEWMDNCNKKGQLLSTQKPELTPPVFPNSSDSLLPNLNRGPLRCQNSFLKYMTQGVD